MNDTTDLLRISAAAGERVARRFAAQQAAFLKQPFPEAEERIAQLKALRRQVSRYQDVLADAMCKDFGYRPPAESKMLDLLGSTLEMNHAIGHVRRWMKSSRRRRICARSRSGSASRGDCGWRWARIRSCCRFR